MLDAYVIGHGIPELAAALELAEVGLRVRIASQDFATTEGTANGAANESAAGDTPLPLKPDAGVADHEGHLRALMAHVAAPIGAASATSAGNPDLAAVSCEPTRTLLQGPRGQWLPLPEPNIWGIPAVPMAREATALLGRKGALRATVDRVRPVLTIGQTHKLGALVRTRMGQQALDRLVSPVVEERFGRPAHDVDVAIAAPGLNGALTSAGSLSGAVLTEAADYVARETLTRPAGGWDALRARLLERLSLYNVQFGGAVEAISELAADPASSTPNTTPHWHVREQAGGTFDCVALVVGLGEEREVPAAVRKYSETTAAWRPVLQAIVPEASVPAELVAAVRGFERAHEDRTSAELTLVTAISALEVAGWTATFSRLAAGQWRVQAQGPVATSADDATDAEVNDDARGNGVPSGSLVALPPALLQTVMAEVPAITGSPCAWALAPDATTAGRDAAETARESERLARPWELRVGVRLHAGDLAEAVADARHSTVQLRRRLVGISD